MSILDIDAGNTRLKWRLVDRGERVDCGVVNNAHPDVMVEALSQQIKGTVSVCRLASVKGADFIAKLCDAIEKVFGIRPKLPIPENGTGHLMVTGVEPRRLGMDRWLAMVGAVHLYPGQAVMVIDSGTALTLDVVGEDGIFRGGLICPGLNTMLKAMVDSADLLVMPDVLKLHRGLAFASVQAVQNGALTMAVSLIEKEVERYSGELIVILCGGDARLLAENVSVPVNLHPELVFQGLDIALPLPVTKD